MESFHKIQNRPTNGLIAERSSHHGIINRAFRLFDAEILPDEIAALPITGIHEQQYRPRQLPGKWNLARKVYAGFAHDGASGSAPI